MGLAGQRSALAIGHGFMVWFYLWLGAGHSHRFANPFGLRPQKLRNKTKFTRTWCLVSLWDRYLSDRPLAPLPLSSALPLPCLPFRHCNSSPFCMLYYYYCIVSRLPARCAPLWTRDGPTMRAVKSITALNSLLRIRVIINFI